MHEPVFLVSLLCIEIDLVAKHHHIVLFELIHARFQVTNSLVALEVIVSWLLTFSY